MLKFLETNYDNSSFLKEKVLFRLAECSYRTERIQEGLAFLGRLEKSI